MPFCHIPLLQLLALCLCSVVQFNICHLDSARAAVTAEGCARGGDFSMASRGYFCPFVFDKCSWKSNAV